MDTVQTLLAAYADAFAETQPAWAQRLANAPGIIPPTLFSYLNELLSEVSPCPTP